MIITLLIIFNLLCFNVTLNLQWSFKILLFGRSLNIYFNILLRHMVKVHLFEYFMQKNLQIWHMADKSMKHLEKNI